MIQSQVEVFLVLTYTNLSYIHIIIHILFGVTRVVIFFLVGDGYVRETKLAAGDGRPGALFSKRAQLQPPWLHCCPSHQHQ